MAVTLGDTRFSCVTRADCSSGRRSVGLMHNNAAGMGESGGSGKILVIEAPQNSANSPGRLLLGWSVRVPDLLTTAN